MKTLALFIFLLLTQRSYGEYYVEINGFDDGSSSRYYTADKSGVVTIEKNTLAKVYGFKEVSSGVFDVHVQVLSGQHRGKSFLIRQDASRPTLSFYKKTPRPSRSNENNETPTPTTNKAKVKRATLAQRTDGSLSAATANLVTTPNAMTNSNTNQGPSTSSNCTNCSPQRPQNVTLGGYFTPAKIGGKTPKNKQVPMACSQLVNPNSGKIGELGQFMVSLISQSPYKEKYLAPHAMGKLCPRFASLSEEEKLSTWAWFWTALATEESTCNPNVKHPKTVTKNGKTYILNHKEGIGLWAMERFYKDRSWRGPECARVTTPQEQARCSLSIMYKTQLAKGRTAYVPQGSYWGPIHRAERQLIHHMRRVTACF